MNALPASADHTTALLHLLLAGGPLAPRRQLLARSGSPLAAMAAGSTAWRQAGLDSRQIRLLQHPDEPRLQAALDWLASHARHQLYWLGHPGYPALLALAPEPPIGLFLDGDATLLTRPCVAVVGSRAATANGGAIAARMARGLCQAGLLVASGLAAGIDAAAHRASLACAGSGLAVVGTGLDRSYPAHHAGLQQQLAEEGLVVSEYPPGTPPLAGHFPARNRILAGLCLGVLVVEAAQRSGAMITARLASEAGREVFAVPGSILNPQAAGCHRLLRDGAGLVEDVAEDLLPALRPLLGSLLDTQPKPDRPGVAPLSAAPADAGLRRVWDLLQYSPVDLDELVQRSGLTVAGLSAILIDLELAGWAVNEHGRYQRAPVPPPPQRHPTQAEGNERKHS